MLIYTRYSNVELSKYPLCTIKLLETGHWNAKKNCKSDETLQLCYMRSGCILAGFKKPNSNNALCLDGNFIFATVLAEVPGRHHCLATQSPVSCAGFGVCVCVCVYVHKVKYMSTSKASGCFSKQCHIANTRISLESHTRTS